MYQSTCINVVDAVYVTVQVSVFVVVRVHATSSQMTSHPLVLLPETVIVAVRNAVPQATLHVEVIRFSGRQFFVIWEEG